VAIDQAEIKLSQRIVNQRLIPNAMETRGSIGRYDPGTGEYTLWATSQAPHVMRLLITAFVMGIPEQKLRVISPDMGGGFGSKIFLYFDMPLTLALAKRVSRPVKYIEDRSENYMSTTHGRDHITDIEIGATRDGKIAGLNVTTYANMGGYLSTIAPGIPTTLYGRMLSGSYKVPNIHCDVYGVYTNTAMVDAYRGAGRPEAAFVIERTCRHWIGRSRRSAIASCARSRNAGSTVAQASCSASASRRTSKSAASLRRSGSDCRAKAGAPGSGRAPTSRCI
jgi:carbon-monoxide dehydrogenase large subunit